MIAIEYFLILLAWILLLVGFYSKSYEISILASMFLIVVGIFLAITGLPSIDGFLTSSIAAVHILIGVYVLLRGTLQQVELVWG